MFFAFRIMVGIAMIMLATVICGWVLRLRGRLFASRWYLRLCEFTAPLGWVAVLAGWTTTEVGRQPWTIYGHFRTADSVTPSLTGHDVLVSLIAYMIVYLVMFPAGVIVMLGIVRRGPNEEAMKSAPIEGRQLRAPISPPVQSPAE